MPAGLIFTLFLLFRWGKEEGEGFTLYHWEIGERERH
jgi:hypothetical protein